MRHTVWTSAQGGGQVRQWARGSCLPSPRLYIDIIICVFLCQRSHRKMLPRVPSLPHLVLLSSFLVSPDSLILLILLLLVVCRLLS